ncbi:4Fe-4S binding protein [Desulfovibrio ferrophilus]|uniref:4Fe-4S ferredoxin iron-sulfur binding domain protein n=1 Tax=Desulfovibrio ferrophilus TaxID=241368 RepID=A0A2Z6AUM5_9BACT|nr:4Fe-4S binding protein [Desulfovibrio ferrophilus]BBD06895.1 4Fe-4S ferredoxin iron-sulfur binding domain protein [Desulfovibrio ferrophilus]
MMKLSALLEKLPARRSTVAFIKEAERIPGYSWLEKLHGYIYGRWTYFYISVGIGRHPMQKLFEPLANLATKIYPTYPHPDKDSDTVSWADSYHGKAMPLEEIKQLISIKRDIEIPDLERIIPYKKARSIILKNPERIVLLKCPCRSAQENPCEPLDVCLIVGEPFASFMLEHHADKARLIDQDEAVRILEEEDKRGHVHHAFFKEAILERFYAICNCCDCCCGAMQAQRNGIPMLCSSGYVAVIDEELCKGCGVCAQKCQFHALTTKDGLTRLDPAQCMGCGICVNACPTDALALERDPSRGEPLEIVKLLKKAEQTTH